MKGDVQHPVRRPITSEHLLILTPDPVWPAGGLLRTTLLSQSASRWRGVNNPGPNDVSETPPNSHGQKSMVSKAAVEGTRVHTIPASWSPSDRRAETISTPPRSAASMDAFAAPVNPQNRRVCCNWLSLGRPAGTSLHESFTPARNGSQLSCWRSPRSHLGPSASHQPHTELTPNVGLRPPGKDC